MSDTIEPKSDAAKALLAVRALTATGVKSAVTREDIGKRLKWAPGGGRLIGALLWLRGAEYVKQVGTAGVCFMPTLKRDDLPDVSEQEWRRDGNGPETYNGESLAFRLARMGFDPEPERAMSATAIGGKFAAGHWTYERIK